MMEDNIITYFTGDCTISSSAVAAASPSVSYVPARSGEAALETSPVLFSIVLIISIFIQ